MRGANEMAGQRRRLSAYEPRMDTDEHGWWLKTGGPKESSPRWNLANYAVVAPLRYYFT